VSRIVDGPAVAARLARRAYVGREADEAVHVRFEHGRDRHTPVRFLPSRAPRSAPADGQPEP